jgi:peptidoglycan/xylan/chitin deacetylase (PgdA/CDA1 family)
LLLALRLAASSENKAMAAQNMTKFTAAAPGRLDLLSGALGRMAGNFGPIVLMYHSVEATSGTPGWKWAVSIDRFRQQVDYLVSAGWSFLRLSDLGSNRSGRTKQVVITFDDAYANTLQAAEFLNRFNLPASWFVVSSAMSGQSTWTDPGAPSLATLRPHQLRALAVTGMEIGAHSRTHRRLAQIERAELDSETIYCKKEIEDALGEQITSFSYPYGSYNPAVIESVRQAGFKQACTTINGTVSARAERLALPRLAVTANDTISGFVRKLFLVDDDGGLRGLVRSARRML